jgi:hypothetical protein
VINRGQPLNVERDDVSEEKDQTSTLVLGCPPLLLAPIAGVAVNPHLNPAHELGPAPKRQLPPLRLEGFTGCEGAPGAGISMDTCIAIYIQDIIHCKGCN